MLGKAIHESLYFLWKSFSVVHLVAIFIGFVIVTYFMLRFWKVDVVTCCTSHGPSDTKEGSIWCFSHFVFKDVSLVVSSWSLLLLVYLDNRDLLSTVLLPKCHIGWAGLTWRKELANHSRCLTSLAGPKFLHHQFWPYRVGRSRTKMQTRHLPVTVAWGLFTSVPHACLRWQHGNSDSK